MGYIWRKKKLSATSAILEQKESPIGVSTNFKVFMVLIANLLKYTKRGVNGKGGSCKRKMLEPSLRR